MIKKIFFGAFLCCVTLNTMALEKPDYEILYEDGNIEYRLYEPYLVAQTEVSIDDNYNSASNEGFRRLFKYITGSNTSEVDIAMTAPIICVTTPLLISFSFKQQLRRLQFLIILV